MRKIIMLVLFNLTVALGYARPHMPNTLAVGDIIVGQPVHDLPDKLQQFISNTPHGGSVIVVSFGSFMEYIPRNIAEKFCHGFRQLKTHRVIWKLKYPEYCTPDYAPNVLILPWIPQNDLLAHERVHLFISHGGFNSLIETVYHAKPVIVVPISIDQPANAQLVQVKGIGIRMNLGTFTADELLTNIESILVVNNSYKYAVNRASAILKDKPAGGAAQRVSNIIQHVIKHGDAHLRTGAFKLNTFQYFMFDIFAFLMCFVVLSIGLIGVCLRLTCKLMLRKCCQRSAPLKAQKQD